MSEKMNDNFLQSVADVLENARKNAKAAVDLSMVYAYFETGRLIVEEEQNGSQRAIYGKYLIPELSKYLTERIGRGFSVTNLKQMRKFYQVYAGDQIGQTLSDQLKNLPAVSTGRKFPLSWSHYLKLMRIDNADERHFYEIEATQNHWGIKELNRQCNSALYERLALSHNKDKVMELAEKGQIIEKTQDMLKDPYILEFTGLQERSEYSETELESRILDHLQEFLLELGKGFAFIGRQVRFGLGACSLDVEMETGTGKTYVYIKTMFELNKQYGWSKFIVVVPSIAIREGVYKSFETMQEHFMEHYGKRVRFLYMTPEIWHR